MTVPTKTFAATLLDQDGTELVVPGVLGGRPFTGTPRRLPTLDDSTVKVAVASELVQSQLVQRCGSALETLRAIPDDAWWPLFIAAADLVEKWHHSGRLARLLRAISATGGLPERRVHRGLEGVLRILRGIQDTLRIQTPDGDTAVFATGVCSRPWRLLPAGRSSLVRVPDNFPTIAVEWLQVLAARRPVIVNTSDGDTILTGILVAALLEVGVPPDAVGVVHGLVPTTYRLCDQVVWPGERLPASVDPHSAKTYHFGRSKAILAGADPGTEVWARLARLAFEGAGRLCTNVSSLVVVGELQAARTAGGALAAQFARIPVAPLGDRRARVAGWHDRAAAETLVKMIQREIAAGAVDLTAEHSEDPLLLERDGILYARPTVLLVDRRSPLFGTELPIPFTAVTPVASTTEAVSACARSLIVSVLPSPDLDHQTLVEALAVEPTITKVFAGDAFDRGYVPADPQEGYLVDFLFQKKAITG